MTAGSRIFAVPDLRRARRWAAVMPGPDCPEVAAATADGTTVPLARAQLNVQEHRIVTAVSGEDVWFHVLSLPSRDPLELRQMLDLQMDALTPLPLEEVVYGFEPLEIAGDATRVLVAIARKSAVDECVGALEAEGLPADLVGVDVLATFRGCRRRQVLHADDDLNAFVQVTPTAAHIVVYSGGQPLAIRAVMLGAGSVGADESRDRLLAELQRTMITAQMECPNRVPGLVTWATWTDGLRPGVEELRTRWPGRAECLATNGSGPSPVASLCLEAAAMGEVRLNLLPDEWRERRRRRQLRRALVRTGIALGVMYALGLTAFLVAMGVQRSQLARSKAEADRLRPAYAAARQLHGTLVAMQLQLDTKYSALEVLREVSRLLPENLKLTGFTFKKDLSVTLRGQTTAAVTANEFISRLEQCVLFATVQTKSVRTEGALTKFEVVCSLKSAAAAPTAGGR